MASKIQTFTKSGKPVEQSKGSTPSPLGHFDPTTGRVYQHPRIKNDVLSGGRVTVTNQEASGPARNKRTASLGMGRVLQRGRNRDVA